jgi:hypothetical protein
MSLISISPISPLPHVALHGLNEPSVRDPVSMVTVRAYVKYDVFKTDIATLTTSSDNG